MIKDTIKLGFGLFFLFFSLNNSLFAAEIDNNQILKAVIKSEDSIELNNKLVFDAENSFTGADNKSVKYIWDFGDEEKEEGQQVIHTYKNPGIYTIKLTVTKNKTTEFTEKEVFVYNKMLLLISDSSSLKEKLPLLEELAKKENVLLKVIDSFNSATDFISQEILFKKISSESENISRSNNIILWNEENAGINALTRYIQIYPSMKTVLGEKNIIIIGKTDLIDQNRLANQFESLKPKMMIVTKESAIYGIIETGDKNIKDKIINDGIELIEITDKSGEVKIWSILSYFVNNLINKGVPDNSIAILLLIPVIFTLLIILRQFIGIIFPKIIIPTTIILTFLIIGLYAGIFILLTSAFVIYVTKLSLKNSRLLFTPKISVVYIMTSILIFFLLITNDYTGLIDTQFLSIAIFPIIILSTTTEQLVKLEMGVRQNIKNIIKILIISIFIFFITGGPINLGDFTIQFTKIKEMILIYPEIVIILLLLNLLLGKWTGLRLLERYRFRNLLRHLDN